MWKNMHIMSTNLAKTLIWKYDYDAKLWRRKQRTPSTNDYHTPLNESPHEKFVRTPLQHAVTLFCWPLFFVVCFVLFTTSLVRNCHCCCMDS